MWGNKNPEQKNNAPAKAPEPVAAAIPPKPPVAAAPIPTPSPVAATPAPAAPVFSSPAPSPAPQMSANASRIGPGLKIHGVISGDSDLIVEGETNGKIYLSNARVISTLPRRRAPSSIAMRGVIKLPCTLLAAPRRMRSVAFRLPCTEPSMFISSPSISACTRPDFAIVTRAFDR